MGWDADNSAATSGAILGVIHGRRWMEAQGWDIEDQYHNTTRPGLPDDETITRFGERLSKLARRSIVERGGAISPAGESVTLKIQSPRCIQTIAASGERARSLEDQLRRTLEKDLVADSVQARVRAAYVAIALGEAGRLSSEHPEAWKQALDEIPNAATGLVRMIWSAPLPPGESLRKAAREAGLRSPTP